MGKILWVLHAHLPYVRHPEHERFFEEDWLFEALESAYLPLLEVLEGWVRDRIPVRIALSISPPLLAMWQDGLLRSRFRAYLDRRSALFAEEARRLRRDAVLGPLAEEQQRRLGRARAAYERTGADMVTAFARLEAEGVVELLTTAATHALLPMFVGRPGFVRAQIRAGLESHTRVFGRSPKGFWLPECGWYEGADEDLVRFGVRYTFVEGSGLGFAQPTPIHGLHRGVATEAGLLVLGRDPVVARQVWGRKEGYPGDPWYLDFYRDSTIERSTEEIRPHLLPTGVRVPLGLRYHRVTDRHSPARDKRPYDPRAATAAVHEHARAFVGHRLRSFRRLRARTGPTPISVAPFDAELFGHWWREGPAFLDAAARLSVGHIEWVTGSDLLDHREVWEVVRPAQSTWGESGDLSVWLSPETAGIWPSVLDEVDALERWAGKATSSMPKLEAQWAREVFLAAASDWPFLVRVGTARDYALRKVQTHLARAEELRHMVLGGPIDGARVARLEAWDNIFPVLDYPWLRQVEVSRSGNDRWLSSGR